MENDRITAKEWRIFATSAVRYLDSALKCDTEQALAFLLDARDDLVRAVAECEKAVGRRSSKEAGK